ncbi:MAG: hypothetical protein V1744_08525 [Candidatus Altiarchaeota archaeon]
MQGISRILSVVLIVSLAVSAVSAQLVLRNLGTLSTVSTSTSTTTTLKLSMLSSGVSTLTATKPTTTTVAKRCEAVTNPSSNTCEAITCPEGLKCTYKPGSSNTAAAYIPPKCACEGVTTTTLPAEVRCEAVSDASSRTCIDKLCPQDMKCTYKPGSSNTATAYFPAKCVCEGPATTTTTIPSYTWCEDISNPSARMCLQGLCPPNTVCRLKTQSQSPVAYLAANAASATRCACVPCECDTTTTTLPVRCEAVDNANANTCVAGLCPDGTRCVFKPGTQAANYMAAAPVGGKCICEPVTTTTLPNEVKCEAVKMPSANTCVEGLCPPEYDCRYVSLASAANVAACRCVPRETTTTTLPGQVKCEAMTGASANTCAQGLCPTDYKCRYVQSPTGANAGSCECIPPTTTTLPGEVKCEAMEKVDSAKQCVDGLCPPDHNCVYVPYADTNIGYCKCALDTTTTTLKPVSCEEVVNPNEKKCVAGKCPDDYLCRYRTDDAGVGVCKCVEKPAAQQATTTTVRKVTGVRGMLDTILGWFT